MKQIPGEDLLVTYAKNQNAKKVQTRLISDNLSCFPTNFLEFRTNFSLVFRLISWNFGQNLDKFSDFVINQRVLKML